jgi:Zn-dependent protease/CBS domain-containing protein
MKWAFKVARIFGIPIKVHITFLLLLVFVAIIGEDITQGLYGVLFVILVFFCVILHELSHSLVAIYFGHTVRSITLLPIGGMAQMDDIPEDSKEEILISLAGPAASIAISGILYLVLYLLDIPVTLLDAESFFEGNMLLNLFWINIILAAFNIIPAFPMDGGRVLRGILNIFTDHMKATRIAVLLGQLFAVVLFFLGVFYNLWLALIAVFIYLGAEGEERMWAIRHALADAKVNAVMLTDFISFSPSDTLSAASDVFLHSLQGNFPVLFGDTLVGILTRGSIVNGINQKKESERIAEFMDREFLSATEKQPLVILYKQMMEKRVSMVPVLRGNVLVGIVTMEQIGRYHMLATARGAK